MNRDKVENILLKIGIPASVKGFDYIADAIDVFEEMGYRVSITKILYPEIAKRNKTTPSRVERAIRHAFEIANSAMGNYENYEKYIGFTNTTNAAALVSLYKHIKAECEDPENAEINGISPELERTIREIVRRELKRMVSA